MHKPPREDTDPAQVLLGFLDYYRSVVTRKLDGLTDTDLRTSRLPSDWTPLELVNHLVHMERRWLRWGFRAEPVPDPHGDEDARGRWRAGPEVSPASLTRALREAGEQTRAVVASARLADISAAGGRFTAKDRRPSLVWVLTYVLQEYARHAGHLDIARELADGTLGE